MANDGGNIKVGKTRSSMDVATIVGLLSGFGLVAAAIFLGGDPASFVNPPAILIVIGGTLAITTMCFTISDMARTLKVIGKTFF